MTSFNKGELVLLAKAPVPEQDSYMFIRRKNPPVLPPSGAVGAVVCRMGAFGYRVYFRGYPGDGLRKDGYYHLCPRHLSNISPLHQLALAVSEDETAEELMRASAMRIGATADHQGED